MADLVLYIIWKLSGVMRERYPSGVAGEDARYHVKFYLKWGWLLPPIWVVQILWRECITDGHLRRIWDDVETPEAILDFKTDLLTRFAGLAIPFIVESIILFGIVLGTV